MSAALADMHCNAVFTPAYFEHCFHLQFYSLRVIHIKILLLIVMEFYSRHARWTLLVWCLKLSLKVIQSYLFSTV